MTTSRRFHCHPQAVPAARRFIRAVLSEESLEVRDAAELMTSELVTNCVRHARTDFELTVHANGGIRVEVSDSGAGSPTPLRPAPREFSGRGLHIVEEMSDAWGVIPAGAGKAVWFTLGTLP